MENLYKSLTTSIEIKKNGTKRPTAPTTSIEPTAKKAKITYICNKCKKQYSYKKCYDKLCIDNG